ncbi:Protein DETOXIFICATION 55 [Linum grandiflorum]
MVAAEKSHHDYPTMPQVAEELTKMADIGFPVATISFLSYLKNMILVVCMGRLGSLELAGGALAIGFTNITGYSLLSGLATGMEPLCSQALGSKNLLVASRTLGRTILMLLVASIPIALLWINLEPIMLTLHQDLQVIRVASLYCRFSIPDLIANSILHPIRIYLRSRGSSWLLMWCTLIPVLLHLPIAIILAFTLNLGVAGLAISTFITNFNAILLLIISYVCFINNNDNALKDQLLLVHPKPSSNSNEWGVLLRLAIPSCVAVCLEWWWYEFMTILSGYLTEPRVALATSAIVIQTTSLMYILPSSLSASASTRVGNELGAGRPQKARLAAIVSIGVALLTSLLGLLGTTVGREAWGRLFIEDKEVLELTITVLPIIGVCELANCPQTTSCGILRGTARPAIGAAINFYSFYLVGAPLAFLLAFVFNLGFVGLCYGLLAAQLACVISILTVVYKTDWPREAFKAQNMLRNTTHSTSAHDEEEEAVTFLKCEQGVGFHVEAL